MKTSVCSLWIGDELPPMQRRCVESWLAAGYEYRLFVYDDVGNVPADVVLLDGAEVMPTIWLADGSDEPSRKNHPAVQANAFRYRWLYQYGGIWVDADTICLRRLPADPATIISSEPFKDPPYYHANVAVTRIPPRSPLMELCDRRAAALFQKGIIGFRSNGPHLFAACLAELGLGGLDIVSEPNLFCPIPCWLSEELWKPHALPMPRDAYTLHVWTEGAKKRGVDPQQTPHESSLLGRIWRALF